MKRFVVEKHGMLILIVLLVFACSNASDDAEEVSAPSQPGSGPVGGETPDDPGYGPGDISQSGLIGTSLPGKWRPFSSDSPWNTPIPDDAATHHESGQIMSLVTSRTDRIRFVAGYLTPIWVVNSNNARPVDSDRMYEPPARSIGGSDGETEQPHLSKPPFDPSTVDLVLVHVRSDNIFDRWDEDKDGWSDVAIPLAKELYPEPTEDGHICIVDPILNLAYEMSRYNGWKSHPPTCTTFNIWDLKGDGVGDPFEGKKWWARGGKGSGFPLIAGILRPEEIAAGEIRHALTFSFELNRQAADGRNVFLPPACRSDGRNVGSQYPMEGMRFQLDPSLSDAEFDSWGLTPEAKIVARALQKYGMFLGDNGGDMAIAVQLLGPNPHANREAWDSLFPGLYKSVKKIPTNRFRVVYTGEPIVR